MRVPTFDGNKVKFEEFWSLFQSLVDASNEPVNLKMARLQQSLVGRTHEAIRGLGASAPEYEEAKEILKTKFGGQRRQIRAYMDKLENLPEMRYNDVENFERFADLVRVTVVKLKAKNRHAELGEGTLHSRLVKKLPARNLECYSRWLSVNNKDPAVTSLSDWLKEEVAIRVEAKEMSHGLDDKPPPEQRFPRRKFDERRPRGIIQAFPKPYERIRWSNKEATLRFLWTGEPWNMELPKVSANQCRGPLEGCERKMPLLPLFVR